MKLARITVTLNIAILLCAVLLSGCGGSRFSGSYSTTVMLDGKPILKVSYDFNNDGTVMYMDGLGTKGSQISGTYTVSGNTVLVTLPGQSGTVDFTRSGDALLHAGARYTRE